MGAYGGTECARFGVTSEENRDLLAMTRQYSLAQYVTAGLDRSITQVFDKLFGERKEQRT